MLNFILTDNHICLWDIVWCFEYVYINYTNYIYTYKVCIIYTYITKYNGQI